MTFKKMKASSRMLLEQINDVFETKRGAVNMMLINDTIVIGNGLLFVVNIMDRRNFKKMQDS